MAKSLVSEAVPPTPAATPTDANAEAGKAMFNGAAPPNKTEIPPEDRMKDDLNEQGKTAEQIAAEKATADAATAKKATDDAAAKKAADDAAAAKAVADLKAIEEAEKDFTDEQKAAAKAERDAAQAKKDAEEAKTKETQKAPEKYAEFKLPVGATYDPDIMTKAQAIFKELNLSQEAAQKLVDLNLENMKLMATKGEKFAYEQFETMRSKWREEIQTDPILGGRNMSANQALVAKAVLAFAGKDREGFIQALEMTGAGDNPFVYAFMTNVGKAISNDDYVTGKDPVLNTGAEERPEEIMYGKQP